MMMHNRLDARQYAPATARNREPILAILQKALAASQSVLEIASGTGEHAVFFAKHLPHLRWQPSDINAQARESIQAWREDANLPNLLPPLALDATAPTWEIAPVDAILCINMIHISPWEATQGLFRHAAHLLPPNGKLFLYGPYKRHGEHTAPSNEAFDQSLRQRDPAWGVRDLDHEIIPLALQHGFSTPTIHLMPANNLSLLFVKS
jgi:cyclopropane fatty-acyl-phospholipid synthase-like methyltransferase